jgi:hypothetical protein
MHVIDELSNGEVRIAEAIDDLKLHPINDPQIVLRTVALHRLARLAAQVEGATEVAQAAINAHATRRASYQEAFEAACEDVGLPIPPGPHNIGIDWTTGAVTFTPQLAQ